MKTIRSLIAFAFTFALLLTVPLSAQQYRISNTTLNGSINASQTSLVLASASASSGSSFGAPAAGQCLFVDGELMTITAMNSTTATVRRGSGGTAASRAGTATGPAAHITGAVVFTAPCTAFKSGPPPVSAVSASAKNANVSCSSYPAPWIDVQTANIWFCNIPNNQWSGTNYAKFTYNSVPTGQ